MNGKAKIPRWSRHEGVLHVAFGDVDTRLLGKCVLVGATYVCAGALDRQVELHGTVVSANPDDGVVVAVGGEGIRVTLPRRLDVVQPAPPGRYRVRGSGELVVNPDLFLTCTVTQEPIFALLAAALEE